MNENKISMMSMALMSHCRKHTSPSATAPCTHHEDEEAVDGDQPHALAVEGRACTHHEDEEPLDLVIL